jgi:methylthioribose-1-phosphate isomerase
MTYTFIQSIQWKNDRLILLDQTRLPNEVSLLHLSSIEEVWLAIRHLQVRGAPAIGMAAAYGLYLGIQTSKEKNETELLRNIDQMSDYLMRARPTAINLRWALNRLRNKAYLLHQKEENASSIKKALLQEALLIQFEDEQACRRIGEHGLPLFQDGMGVLTHCNAGSLATAKYGTATAPFYLAKDKAMNLRIFVDETRPVLQGARLTAWELKQAGLDVTLICDNMAAMVMGKGWIQAVIVGTDRVAGNGDVANKIGTYGLAVLANAHQIPFYVAAPLSSIDLDTLDGTQIHIEERPSEEITAGFGLRTAPEGIQVYNPAFDITPHSLITAFVTEKGIVRPHPEFGYHTELQKLFLPC